MAELLENGAFANVAEARLETFNYIELYYNHQRRHSGIGYETPAEYEKRTASARDVELKTELENEKAEELKVSQHSCITS